MSDKERIDELELRLQELDERHQLQIDELVKRLDGLEKLNAQLRAALEKANDPIWPK